MLPEASRPRFIGLHLGQLFREAESKQKSSSMIIMLIAPSYRSRFFRIHWRIHLSTVRLFILYGGQIDALFRSSFRLFQDKKHIYFTEQWIGGSCNLCGDLSLALNQKNFNYSEPLEIGQTVLEWNLTSYPTLTPLLQIEVDVIAA